MTPTQEQAVAAAIAEKNVRIGTLLEALNECVETLYASAKFGNGSAFANQCKRVADSAAETMDLMTR